MASSVNRDGDDDQVTVLAFSLEDDQYCVRADAVASVLGVSDDRSVAAADDPWNAGRVSVGGTPVRVVDLARAFNSSIRTTARVEDPKLLIFSITDAADEHVGWLVDGVDVTRTVRTSALEPTPTSARIDHVKGRLEIDGEDVVWLDEREILG